MNKNSFINKSLDKSQKIKRASANDLKNMVKPVSLKKHCDSLINDSESILNRKISLQEDLNKRDILLPFQKAKIDVGLIKNKY